MDVDRQPALGRGLPERVSGRVVRSRDRPATRVGDKQLDRLGADIRGVAERTGDQPTADRDMATYQSAQIVTSEPCGTCVSAPGI